MQKSVVLAAVVLAGAISLPEQSLAAPGGRGATTGGNAKAWAGAIGDVDRFLSTHLK